MISETPDEQDARQGKMGRPNERTDDFCGLESKSGRKRLMIKQKTGNDNFLKINDETETYTPRSFKSGDKPVIGTKQEAYTEHIFRLSDMANWEHLPTVLENEKGHEKVRKWQEADEWRFRRMQYILEKERIRREQAPDMEHFRNMYCHAAQERLHGKYRNIVENIEKERSPMEHEADLKELGKHNETGQKQSSMEQNIDKELSSSTNTEREYVISEQKKGTECIPNLKYDVEQKCTLKEHEAGTQSIPRPEYKSEQKQLLKEQKEGTEFSPNPNYNAEQKFPWKTNTACYFALDNKAEQDRLFQKQETGTECVPRLDYKLEQKHPLKGQKTDTECFYVMDSKIGQNRCVEEKTIKNHALGLNDNKKQTKLLRRQEMRPQNIPKLDKMEPESRPMAQEAVTDPGSNLDVSAKWERRIKEQETNIDAPRKMTGGEEKESLRRVQQVDADYIRKLDDTLEHKHQQQKTITTHFPSLSVRKEQKSLQDKHGKVIEHTSRTDVKKGREHLRREQKTDGESSCTVYRNKKQNCVPKNLQTDTDSCGFGINMTRSERQRRERMVDKEQVRNPDDNTNRRKLHQKTNAERFPRLANKTERRDRSLKEHNTNKEDVRNRNDITGQEHHKLEQKTNTECSVRLVNKTERKGMRLQETSPEISHKLTDEEERQRQKLIQSVCSVCSRRINDNSTVRSLLRLQKTNLERSHRLDNNMDQGHLRRKQLSGTECVRRIGDALKQEHLRREQKLYAEHPHKLGDRANLVRPHRPQETENERLCKLDDKTKEECLMQLQKMGTEFLQSLTGSEEKNRLQQVLVVNLVCARTMNDRLKMKDQRPKSETAIEQGHRLDKYTKWDFQQEKHKEKSLDRGRGLDENTELLPQWRKPVVDNTEREYLRMEQEVDPGISRKREYLRREQDENSGSYHKRDRRRKQDSYSGSSHKRYQRKEHKTDSKSTRKREHQKRKQDEDPGPSREWQHVQRDKDKDQEHSRERKHVRMDKDEDSGNSHKQEHQRREQDEDSIRSRERNFLRTEQDEVPGRSREREHMRRDKKENSGSSRGREHLQRKQHSGKSRKWEHLRKKEDKNSVRSLERDRIRTEHDQDPERSRERNHIRRDKDVDSENSREQEHVRRNWDGNSGSSRKREHLRREQDEDSEILRKKKLKRREHETDSEFSREMKHKRKKQDKNSTSSRKREDITKRERMQMLQKNSTEPHCILAVMEERESQQRVQEGGAGTVKKPADNLRVKSLHRVRKTSAEIWRRLRDNVMRKKPVSDTTCVLKVDNNTKRQRPWRVEKKGAKGAAVMKHKTKREHMFRRQLIDPGRVKRPDDNAERLAEEGNVKRLRMEQKARTDNIREKSQ